MKMQKTKLLPIHVVVAVAALALTGCGQSYRSGAGNRSAVVPLEDRQVTNYRCDDGTTIAARYPTTETARIRIKGEWVDLHKAIAASGARYVGGGWQWWTKGDKAAALTALKPGEDIASADPLMCAAS